MGKNVQSILCFGVWLDQDEHEIDILMDHLESCTDDHTPVELVFTGHVDDPSFIFAVPDTVIKTIGSEIIGFKFNELRLSRKSILKNFLDFFKKHSVEIGPKDLEWLVCSSWE